MCTPAHPQGEGRGSVLAKAHLLAVAFSQAGQTPSGNFSSFPYDQNGRGSTQQSPVLAECQQAAEGCSRAKRNPMSH